MKPGDLVIFFAADRLADQRPNPARYHFVGYATVQRKVSQRQVWEREVLSVYRTYGNLLLHPSEQGHSHHETGPRRHWHKDWLWRLTNMSGIKAHQMDKLNDENLWDPSMTVAGMPVEIAAKWPADVGDVCPVTMTATAARASITSTVAPSAHFFGTECPTMGLMR